MPNCVSWPISVLLDNCVCPCLPGNIPGVSPALLILRRLSRLCQAVPCTDGKYWTMLESARAKDVPNPPPLARMVIRGR